MAICQDKGKDCNKSVRGRLLDAAEELFCEHGFEGTSIRELAAVAHCNIASVNYYFGGKDKLYNEVFRRHFLMMRNTRIASIDKVMSQNGGKPLLEDLLRSFANAFIEPLVDESKGRRLIKLMSREMVDLHLPRNIFLDEIIIPTLTVIQEALVKTCPGLEESKARLAILSIVAQLLHIVRVRAMFERADFDMELPGFDLPEVVNHIVAFSAAGIRAYAEEKTE